MDAQELRNLQEAYMEVYQEQELDEEITPERRAQYKRGLKVRQSDQETVGKGRPRKRATSPQPGAQHYRKGMTQSHRDTMRDVAREENPERPEGSGSLPKGKKLERQKKTGVSAESYDIYDIILSHLLDEGYAETPEAAEVIMVNMSEEWREDIVEELTGGRKKRALQIGTELAKRVALAKEGQPITRKGPPYLGSTKKAPSKRGGSGIKGDIKAVWTGYADDRGSGNKSRRRRGIKVQDTSDEL